MVSRCVKSLITPECSKQASPLVRSEVLRPACAVVSQAVPSLRLQYELPLEPSDLDTVIRECVATEVKIDISDLVNVIVFSAAHGGM